VAKARPRGEKDLTIVVSEANDVAKARRPEKKNPGKSRGFLYRDGGI
jgi:hypothetical protein